MQKYFFIILLLIISSCKKNSQASHLNQLENISTISNDNNSNDTIIQTIRNFYLESYNDDFPPKTDEIRKKYLSYNLLNKINELSSDSGNLILDYDPFIKGQDYNASVITKTLQIQPINNNNEYRVSLLLFGNKNEQKTTIDLSIIKHNGKYLIDRILNDSHLNFKSNNNKVVENKINIVAQGSSIIITKNDKKKKLKSLNINEASLSTTYKTINDNEICLIYENSASIIKSVEIYTLALRENKLYLMSKEVVKLGEAGIEDNVFLYDKLVDDDIDYEKLSNLDYREEDLFSKNPIKKTIYKNSKIIEIKEYQNISPEDYFINRISTTN